MKAGKLHHEYNFFGLEHTNIAASKPIAAGKHTVKYEFVFDGGKPGAGGQSILYVDGQKVAAGKIPKTQPYAFSADEGVDVGVDNETPDRTIIKKGTISLPSNLRKLPSM